AVHRSAVRRRDIEDLTRAMPFIAVEHPKLVGAAQPVLTFRGVQAALSDPVACWLADAEAIARRARRLAADKPDPAVALLLTEHSRGRLAAHRHRQNQPQPQAQP